MPPPPLRDDESRVGLIRQCLPWSPESATRDTYSQREGETAGDTRVRCQRRVAELAEELEMLKEVLACSEIENVERIAAQLHEAKQEADRTASEAAAAVATAQEAAERVTALAADLEHARAEADSFALIAELEAAKEDADNAAAYWSDPTDAEDSRIYCEGGAPIMNDKCNSQKYSDDLPDERSTLQPIQQLPSSTPPLDENEDASPMPELAASPSGACSPQTAGSPSQRAGCYLVLEDKNQGTLTATWSRMMPTSSYSVVSPTAACRNL